MISRLHSLAHNIRRIALAAAMLLPLPASAHSNINMPYGVTEISHDIYHLHMTILYVCCVIGLLVFGVLFYSLFKYRRSKGAVATPFHEHLGVEILWTVIPTLILVVMAIPATRVLSDIHDTKKPALTVKITGYQWKWSYEYLDQNIKFFSNLSTPQDEIQGRAPKNKWYLLQVDHPLVVPVHQKVRLLITSNDVIHDWWVPDLGVKQDAIPGYVNENWFKIDKPGVYRGECAELCGIDHAYMPIVVKAVPQKEFAQWVASHSPHAKKTDEAPKIYTKEQLMTKGQTAYNQYCGACHQPTGAGLPPTFPALKGGAISTGPVANHIAVTLTGVKGTAMQAFGEQLDNDTLAAIITYERNAWGNDKIASDLVVQPSDIIAARKKS